ncbi:hypothetical protein DNU06_04450 [Putridiphycobacter roseus]|uniref:Carboxypeptidase-like regulatory domain-containing protein n=1 Tax=Putridiphycobacter roseus TaxID=2219161 RepID=A0A2W1N236_9FLAO|nr:DUF5686 and carboxypeptidase regulatory-like domain-containing protein [Putridiphycobacter roseus]PZE17874.1 hypothetical protein DNU06_04450 [Putridiphycobacter roseus]
MTKYWIVLIGILFSFQLNAQFVLKGAVTDMNGEPLPGVKVYVDGTTFGVITDYNGLYFLELKKADQYPIHFKMMGMEDTVVTVFIQKKLNVFDISLKEKSIKLESVEVLAKKINVANTVIKHMQDNRSKMALQVDNYTCNTYLKTGLEREPRIQDSTVKAPAKMSLIESISQTTFIAKNTYHEKIIAQHDYSDKEAAVAESFIDYYQEDIITPIQAVEVDPYIFYEKVQDGDFNLYQHMIDLPKIAEYPITSPFGAQAFTNYKFELNNIFYENELKIYEIQVTPRFKNAALLKGQLYIVADIWAVKSFNLSINPSAMPFFYDFNVIQDYENIDGNWVVVRREFTYTIQEDEDFIRANTRVKHSDYVFNRAIRVKDFKNEISNYSADAFSKDSVFWNKNRPLKLKDSELHFIGEQERIDSVKQSEHYLDSVDAVFNKITLGDIFLSGVGFRNRFKEQEIYIAPLLGSFELFGVGGVRFKFSGDYSKKFENNHKIKISPSLNYGFLNKDLKPTLALEYTFLPMKFGSVAVAVGNDYDRITNQTTAVNYVLGAGSYISNKFVSLAHRREIVNGLYGRIKFSYADRQPLGDIELGPIFTYFEQLDTAEPKLFPTPPAFKPYTVSFVEFKFQYRFNQKYIIKQNEKLIIGSVYPELEVSFKQGIPNLFGSEVRFNQLEFRVSDEINLGNYGDSKWKVIGGSFLNKQDLRIIEHKFIKQSDVALFTNPLESHQGIDTNYNTSAPYVQAFYVHHFNGLFLNKIPLIQKLRFETFVGGSFILLDEFDYNHSEFFIGVERKFRFLKEYYKFAFVYTGQFNDIVQPYFRFKIGFDFLNTYTNQWSW